MEVINIDWLNENAFRNYPIIDGASRQSIEGAILPNSLIVDLKLSVPFGIYPLSSFFIHSVQGIGVGVIISFAALREPSRVLASSVVLMANHTQYATYPVVGIPNTPLEKYVGSITIGTLDAVRQCSKTNYTFTHSPVNTSIVVSCIVPTRQALQNLVVINGNTEKTITAQNVRFVAGENVTLDYNDNTGEITISSKVVVSPSELATAFTSCKTSLSDEDDLEDIVGSNNNSTRTAGCIKTINGIPPDANGNFVLQARGGISFQNLNGKLTVIDTNSQPCCTNSQVQEMYANLQLFEKARAQLLSAVEQLNSRVSNLAAAVMSAGLGLCLPKDTQQNAVTWIFNADDGSIIPGE